MPAVPHHHRAGARHRPHQRPAAAQRQPLGPDVRHLRRLHPHQLRAHHQRGDGRAAAQDRLPAVRLHWRRAVRGHGVAPHPRLAHPQLLHALPPSQDVHGHDDQLGHHRHLHGLPLLRGRRHHRPIRAGGGARGPARGGGGGRGRPSGQAELHQPDGPGGLRRVRPPGPLQGKARQAWYTSSQHYPPGPHTSDLMQVRPLRLSSAGWVCHVSCRAKGGR
ncbi:hypothetical protein FOCC_FOCC016154 [Frankliniella occidentalis]|nr:hypothetical protein FOCC_FOCC016154 [Frankliniella occidentalis]